MKRFFKVFLFLLVFLLGLFGLSLYWTFYKPLPDYEASLYLPNLQQKVDVHWDSYGVPHIYASNEHDLYYAVGYVHAQDRLWQMTLSQMAAQGRFAEFFGKNLLPYDRFQRTIGFWRIAQKMEHQLSDSTRQILQAYADGVNTYVREHPKSLPIEFALTGVKPIHWTVTHSLALSRMMGWELNIAWKEELNYSYLHEKLTEEQFGALFPEKALLSIIDQPASAENNKFAKALLPLVRYQDKLDQLLGSEGSHVGSNAWAIDASKSTTDYPLLAGDPHLGLSMPGKWYEVHLNLKGKNLSGATLPGAPVVVLGQNDFLAWSLTNIMLDDTDFFEEAVNPDSQNQYVLDSLAGDPLFENFIIQQEVIKIKDNDDTTFTRKLTKHGPVVSNLFPVQDITNNRVITMKWTGSEPTHEVDALLGMDWAQSFSQFKKSIKNFKVPGQNVIYADKAGNIALFSLANIPIRNGNPILIRKGWKPDQDWQGYVPFGELPKTINPDRGWVANANNPPFPQDYPYYISAYWEPDSRYRRIEQYLSQNAIMSPETFQVMQNDSYAAFSRDLTKQILPVLQAADSTRYATVISYLENWDYKYDPSETAASILDVFLLNFSRNLFEDEMGPDAYKHFINFSAIPLRAISRFMKNGSIFFDNIHTSEKESENDLITKSMDQALAYLRKNFGAEPFEWRWEKLHTLTLEPPLLGQAAKKADAPEALKLIVDNLLSKGPFNVKGNDISINNGEYKWNNPYKMVLGPSIRRIIDFSNLSKTLSILPTGQSGNPLSEYYGDQTESWLDGQYKFLYQDSTFFRENKYHTMELIPKNKTDAYSAQ